MKTIKSLSIMLFFALAFSTTSCKKDKTDIDIDQTGKTGTFSIDGVSYSGETEVQTFVNDNYSIICEQDEPYKFIQITFRNKAEAEAGGTFNVVDDAFDIPTGGVNIGIDGLTFDPIGSKTISVSGKKITLSNIPLEQTGEGSLRPVVNSASINF